MDKLVGSMLAQIHALTKAKGAHTKYKDILKYIFKYHL